jgi:hypothetical protein
MGPGGTNLGAPAFAIEFANGSQAQAIIAAPRRSVESLLEGLGLSTARPVLLVVGGADAMDQTIDARLGRLLERGAIRAADEVGATVLDGGTASGVMAALGRASAASDATVALIGVAPAGKVTYPADDRNVAGASTQLEPNHTHFVLANSDDWGGETSLLFDVLDTLAFGQPAAVLLAGGGPIALDEVRLAAQRGLPIIVLAGTGGIADELEARSRATASRKTGDTLAEVIQEADLAFLALTADPADLQRVLVRSLQVDETLAEAWAQQKLVSSAARRQRGDFQIGQSVLLVLGLFVTYLVIAKTVLEAAGIIDTDSPLASALHFVILLVPISVATLAAAASRMRPAGRWILLRGTSEGLKREIFRYRARAGIYSHAQTRKTPREVKLAQAVGSAMGSLMRTDVNVLALDSGSPARRQPEPEDVAGRTASPKMPVDNPLAPLTPSGYVRHRIDAQIEWYRRKIADLERQARWLRWLAIGFGGMGTLLAAIRYEIWVAVTTSLVGIYTTLLEAWQLETSVTLYNQASTDLIAIRAWWFALPPTDQDRQEYIDRLVDKSEQIMRAEHVGWVQDMQDAMTQLRLEEAADEASGAKPHTKDRAPDTDDDPARSH